MSIPNFPHRLAGRTEKCKRSRSQSPFSPVLRLQAWPGLPLSRVHVCTSAPWFLQEPAASCTGQGKRKWQSQQRMGLEPINFLICGWEKGITHQVLFSNWLWFFLPKGAMKYSWRRWENFWLLKSIPSCRVPLLLHCFIFFNQSVWCTFSCLPEASLRQSWKTSSFK